MKNIFKIYKGYNLYMETIKLKIIDNFRITGNYSKVFLTINGKEVWNSSMLQKKEVKGILIQKTDSYEIKVQDDQRIYKQKTIDQLDNKLIKVVSRKSPAWLGLRGLMWQGMMILFASKYTFKIRIHK